MPCSADTLWPRSSFKRFSRAGHYCKTVLTSIIHSACRRSLNSAGLSHFCSDKNDESVSDILGHVKFFSRKGCKSSTIIPLTSFYPNWQMGRGDFAYPSRSVRPQFRYPLEARLTHFKNKPTQLVYANAQPQPEMLGLRQPLYVNPCIVRSCRALLLKGKLAEGPCGS